MISLEGSIVDLMTPFGPAGVDEREFADLVAWQIAEGSRALATGTTTGEGPTLSATERERLVRICVEVAAGRVPVIAATGTNGTESTIALTRRAQAAGADAALIVIPYYNRPSQDGIIRHFEAIARAVHLPLIVHNQPSRTGIDLQPVTIARLCRIGSVVGVCDAGPDPARLLGWATSEVKEGFAWLCGSDAKVLEFSLVGGRGALSVAANVAPRLCATLCGRNLARAAEAHRRLMPLIEALRRDDAPVGIKHAVALVRPGFEPRCRLPLVGVSAESHEALAAALRKLINGRASPAAQWQEA